MDSLHVERFLSDVFGEEDGNDALRQCHGVRDEALGLYFYAVAPDGTIICPRSSGPRFCDMVQSSQDGCRACQAHFVETGRACLAGDGEPIGRCHAGLVSWAVKLGSYGVMAGCGGRAGTAHSPASVRQLAERLGLDADELVKAYDELPEHSLESLTAISADLVVSFNHMCRTFEQLTRIRCDRELEQTRREHLHKELATLKNEYLDISREAYAKNEELLKANRQLQGQIAENQEMFMGFIRALSSAVDAKDPYTNNHSQRVTKVALLIGEELGLRDDEMKTLEIAGFLHDIGKIGMPENILNKPGRLTDEEFVTVKQHPVVGARIVSGVKQLTEPANILLHHHERFDGGGYPDGLEGTDIPLASRILAVADTFDAITSDRPYRKGASTEHAIEELKRCSGTQFDPQMVEAFEQIHNKGLLPGDLDMATVAVGMF